MTCDERRAITDKRGPHECTGEELLAVEGHVRSCHLCQQERLERGLKAVQKLLALGWTLEQIDEWHLPRLKEAVQRYDEASKSQGKD